ncbi:hypothetical protein GBF38_015240, partial [Nibea albiflora]
MQQKCLQQESEVALGSRNAPYSAKGDSNMEASSLLPTPASQLCVSSLDRGRASMPRVRSLEHRALQEWSLFNSLPPDARQNSPPGYGREQKAGKGDRN